MEEQFVPFELSIKLEELGFKENVLATYFKDGYFLHIPYNISLDKLKNVRAPLWQQAFDWFRVNHGHYSNIVPNPTRYIEHQNCDWLFGYNIINSDNPIFDLRYKTYEEARIKCLDKLIELAETKKDSV